jgi:hypothetical protein
MDVRLCVEHPLRSGFHHQPHQSIEVIDRRGLARHLTGGAMRRSLSSRLGSRQRLGYT